MKKRPDVRVLEGLQAVFHQDFDLEFADVEEAAAAFVDNLDRATLAQVDRLVADLTARYTPAEIKGILNRICPDVAFHTQGARRVMTTIRLQSERRLKTRNGG